MTDLDAFTDDDGADQPEPWAGSARWPRPFLYADLDDGEPAPRERNTGPAAVRDMDGRRRG